MESGERKLPSRTFLDDSLIGNKRFEGGGGSMILLYII